MPVSYTHLDVYKRQVPHKAVQHVLDRMVTVLIRHDGERRRHFLLAGQAVVLLKIEKQIFHIRIRQGAGVPAPAQVPHDVHPVSQEVQPDGVPQERVMAEHRPGVADVYKRQLDKLWDCDGNYIDSSTLTVYMRRLRMKIEDNPSDPQMLLTVRRMGYKWNVVG